VDYAKQHGIVQDVFPRNELYAKTEDFAKLLELKPREALRAAKHEITATMSKSLSEALQIEIKEFASTLQTDGKRIIAEWFEKKK
jgi:enoyl-CoA hydratase/carnithine racemase